MVVYNNASRDHTVPYINPNTDINTMQEVEDETHLQAKNWKE